MIETIIKKLLDREECDFCNSDSIGFYTEKYAIFLHIYDDCIVYTINGDNYHNNGSIKYASNKEQKYIEYRYTSLYDKYVEKVENELYKEIMEIDESKEHTFDEAQTEIVNNVEE